MIFGLGGSFFSVRLAHPQNKMNEMHANIELLKEIIDQSCVML
jgi:hypothetical protein